MSALSGQGDYDIVGNTISQGAEYMPAPRIAYAQTATHNLQNVAADSLDGVVNPRESLILTLKKGFLGLSRRQFYCK